MGEWQTLDVDFRSPRFDGTRKLVANARATVHFNGVMIHDNVELGPRKGAAKRLGDATEGPIMFQDHGSRYLFRNIWIVEATKSGSDEAGR
jgi:3-keto-disaccharide hydrolase